MRHIKFNGKKSSDFHLYLESEMSLPSPAVNLEFEKVPGRDGELAIGDGTMNNVEWAFPFSVAVSPDVGKVESVAHEVSNWLKGNPGWHDFEYSEDPEHIYKALFYEEYDTERVLSILGKCVLKFKMKPVKYMKIGLDPIVLPSFLRNPTNRSAKPRLIIKGSGNITIQIGAQKLTLKNVSNGGIIVDTLYETVTSLDGKRNEWNKVTSYPLLQIEPGRQTVTRSGSITSVEIVPRWEVIL